MPRMIMLSELKCGETSRGAYGRKTCEFDNKRPRPRKRQVRRRRAKNPPARERSLSLTTVPPQAPTTVPPQAPTTVPSPASTTVPSPASTTVPSPASTTVPSPGILLTHFRGTPMYYRHHSIRETASRFDIEPKQVRDWI
ncbi:3458_t:CDS:2, partial [Paraglomus occultum]